MEDRDWILQFRGRTGASDAVAQEFRRKGLGLDEAVRAYGAVGPSRPALQPGARIVGFSSMSASDVDGQNYHVGGGRSHLAVVDAQERVVQAAKKQTGDPELHGLPNVRLILWRNGFSVDDGPLRPADSDEGRRFLADIEKGVMPPELAQRVHDDVDLEVIDRRERDYEAPPPQPMQAFSGTAYALGSSDSAGGNAAKAQAPVANGPAPQLDPSAPVTSVQVRLPGGGRRVLKLNTAHTVADLLAALRDAEPSIPATVRLQQTFPPAPLENLSLTLTEAGLCNASVLAIF